MSIILTLLVLFLSLHSCNARILGVAHIDDHHAHSISNQEKDEKVIVRRDVLMSEKSVKETAETAEKTRDSSVSKKSFKVPHKKRGEKEEAGFNLDYLPPKTHPPSHN